MTCQNKIQTRSRGRFIEKRTQQLEKEDKNMWLDIDGIPLYKIDVENDILAWLLRYAMAL